MNDGGAVLYTGTDNIKVAAGCKSSEAGCSTGVAVQEHTVYDLLSSDGCKSSVSSGRAEVIEVEDSDYSELEDGEITHEGVLHDIDALHSARHDALHSAHHDALHSGLHDGSDNSAPSAMAHRHALPPKFPAALYPRESSKSAKRSSPRALYAEGPAGVGMDAWGRLATPSSYESNEEDSTFKSTSDKCPVSLEMFLDDHNLSQNPDAPREVLTAAAARTLVRSHDAHHSRCMADGRSTDSSNRRVASFFPLTLDEIALMHLRSKTGGMLVALDAEFVAVDNRSGFADNMTAAADRYNPVRATDQDPTTPKISQKLEMPKPSQLALARVSLVRADGDLKGLPFMDHYVQAKEQTKDYLTEYSGVFPGDLEVMSCPHWLTTKKKIHQKLRYLVDSHCCFIGHGLATDFRILNLQVPRDQILDTVELYRLPGHRLLSLKYLCAAVLGYKIQGYFHDSVEDSRAALNLYMKLKEVREHHGVAGMEALVKAVYDSGYKSNWQITDNVVGCISTEEVALTSKGQHSE